MRNAVAAICALSMPLSGCTSLSSISDAKLATAVLRSANGAPAGTALVAASGNEVTITVAAIGLPQGAHGLHLHMVGSCEAPTFASAGGHLNPHAMQHGTANPAGSHLGDLPNLVVDSYGAGTITAEFRDGRTSAEAALFDGDGTAIVIHADPDDLKTDPSGNSGTRLACGVLKRG